VNPPKSGRQRNVWPIQNPKLDKAELAKKEATAESTKYAEGIL